MLSPIVPPCTCSAPGYCARYGGTMDTPLWGVCQGRGVDPAIRAQALARLGGHGPPPQAAASRRKPSGLPSRPSGCRYQGEAKVDAAGEPVLVECPSCTGTVRLKVFACHHPGHAANPTTTRKACKACPDFDPGEGPPPEASYLHAGDLGGATHLPKRVVLCDGDGRTVDYWAGRFAGVTAAFLGGGPSLAEVDLAGLKARGIGLTLGVNNVCQITTPRVWLCADNPIAFPGPHWDDARCLKVVPRAYADRVLRDRRQVQDHSDTLFYRRNARFRAERFLEEPTFNWGCERHVHDGLGNTGGRSVMLVALKLLHYFGVRRVYLLGCDFRMDAERPYAHGQTKGAGAVRMNNRKFQLLDTRFAALRPHFEAAGFEVINATPGSGLGAFERGELPTC